MQSPPSVGPWERWEAAASAKGEQNRASMLRRDSALSSRLRKDLSQGIEAAKLVTNMETSSLRARAFGLQAALRTLVFLCGAERDVDLEQQVSSGNKSGGTQYLDIPLIPTFHA